MPFPMKIQPIDYQTLTESVAHRFEPVKPVVKSRLKRLFERQFLRNSAAEKVGAIDESLLKDGSNEFEPSSVCLAKMVQNFIEENNDKQTSVRCNRNRCYCFNRNCNDSSEDEFDSCGGLGDSNLSSSAEACEILKGLVPCASVCERNLLADTAKIVDKNKISKRKDDVCRKIVTDGLLGLGYDASICKSRWEKASYYPAGEYEYIDVIISGERLLIDIDFRSEFEIARSTKTYKSLLQILPSIFVGKADRLQKIIAIVSDAAKQSLKKKGMPIPPWRKAEYIKAKWLSPHTRTTPPLSSKDTDPQLEREQIAELGLSCQEKNSVKDDTEMDGSVFTSSSKDEAPLMLYFVPINCQFLFRSNSMYCREGCFASVQSRKRQGMKDQNLTMKSEQTRAISSCVSLQQFSTVVFVESRLRGEQLVMGGWHLCRVGFV